MGEWICDAHTHTHTHFEGVQWADLLACIIHNSDCLEMIHSLGKKHHISICCNLQQGLGHTAVEWQTKLQQEALPPKGASLALRQGY